MSLRLRAGTLALYIDPEIGGSVRRLDWHGIPILRPTLDRADAAALESSAFPMVPFGGRIANGKFTYQDQTFQIPPNFPPEPHAIHGYGWQSRWQIAACDANSATLRHTPAPGTWPWAYEATQAFKVSPDEVELTFMLTNKSEADMPAGLGWHPYFPKKDAQVQADTQSVWLSGEDMIPHPPSLVTPHFDLTRPRAAEDFYMDNAFSIGSTVQHLSWPTHNVTLTSDPDFSKLIVYAPQGEDFFCVEPITHAPDALNSGLPDSQTGMVTLHPGQALMATIRITMSAPE